MTAPSHRIVVACPNIEDTGLLPALQREGYEIVTVADSAALQQQISDRPADLVLIDLDLPGGNGQLLIRDLRATSAIGIMVLTARDETIDRIVALEMGADHYVTLPCEPREVAVRVRNLLWRVMAGAVQSAAAMEGTQYRFEDWLFDATKRVLRHPDRGTSVLTRQESAVLQVLVAHPGQVQNRDALMEAVHREWTPTDRTVDVLVGRLRRKIEADPTSPELIVTIYGEGYMFAGTVL